MILQHEEGALTSPTNYGGTRVMPPLFVIIHGSGLPAGATSDGELSYLRRPDIRVSYHFYIRKDGRFSQLVPVGNAAWHCGESRWVEAGTTFDRLNGCSIGIALESFNAPDEVYPAEQIATCLSLVRLQMEIHGIPKERVLTHRQISYPRKTDPVAFPVEAFVSQL